VDDDDELSEDLSDPHLPEEMTPLSPKEEALVYFFLFLSLCAFVGICWALAANH
jgi:hypothetical protein